MEDKEEIKPSVEQDQNKDEKPHKEDETGKEDKVIAILEANQLQEDMTKERHENEAEVRVENRAIEEGKVSGSQNISSKKKQGSKPNLKTKVTIPQPFSLATEKRMSRERRGSMDFKDSNPILSKSTSLNYKVLAQSSLGAERTSNLRLATSASTTKTSSRPNTTTSEHADRKPENHLKTKDKILKEVERKKQVNGKKQEGEESKTSKFRKSYTFKALPLPSFYHRKDFPPTPEINKIQETHRKSPLLGQQSKSAPKSKRNKAEDKDKNVSRTRCSSAKETISKLLKTTRKSLGTPNEMVKDVVSSA
ncbi:hypothetical protein F0562_007717 [Nyssa sinensis]|uniref:TPX2 C-terminal domain-containing protein n=1 Tax=Nyssa sinensis TaxID=561372 RepID=A0A5J5A7L3_9ASTE|nr:hypothetical protein F0562_007717 [Nyssa sinensis]